MRAVNPSRVVADPAPVLVRIALRSEPHLPWRVLSDASGRPYDWPRLEAVWEGTLLCQHGLWEVRLVDECGATLEEYHAVLSDSHERFLVRRVEEGRPRPAAGEEGG